MGLTYSLIDVRSPAPPIIALVGLFGMVIGAQIVPIGARLIARRFSISWFADVCIPEITGVSKQKE